MVVSPPVEPGPSVAPTATENPVTLLGDHLTKDSHKSPLDKTLWAIAIAGLVSLAGPNNHITLAFRLLGFGSSLALLARNDEARKTRQLVTNALFHHGKSIDQAWADGAESGRVGALERAQVVVDELQSQLVAANERVEELGAEAVRVQEQRLALDQRDRLGEAELQRQRLAFEQLKFDYQGEFERLRTANEAQQETIRQLQQSLTEQNEAAKAAIAEALERQGDKHRAVVAELKAELSQAVQNKEASARRLALDKMLLSMREIIESSELGSILFAGPQRSGKGTNLIAWLTAASQIYAGVMPLVLDTSEDQGWSKAGITPFEADERETFWDGVRAFATHLKRRHHTQHPEFKSQPLGVVVIDEFRDMFTGYTKSEAEERRNLLSILESQGAKRGIVVLWTNTDTQVQNMRSGPLTRILNQGLLNNMTLFLFNSAIEGVRSTNTAIPFREGHQDLYELMEGEYRAACVDTSGGYRSMRMVRHASHHGQVLGERELTAPVIALYQVSLPHWMPAHVTRIYDRHAHNRPPLPPAPIEFRAECETEVETLRNQGETAIKTLGETGIKPLRSVYCDDSPFAIETGETATPDLGTWWESEAVSRDERRLIIACREQGLSQKKAVKQIYGKSPGRSEKYRIAATKVKEVYGELSPVHCEGVRI